MAQSLAQQRITKLFDEARRAADQSQERANRYVRIAWSIKLRTNETLTAEQRLAFCKTCKQYIRPAEHRIRLRNGVLTRTCPHCNTHRRIPYGTN
jgi:RNase P subunit RPR2